MADISHHKSMTHSNAHKNSDVINSTEKQRIHVLSCGYIRKYCATRNMNFRDIGQIIGIFLLENWKFDHVYDYKKRGTIIHCVKNNGKMIECTCRYDHQSKEPCFCFYSILSIGMKPQSGKYKIKFQINQIDNQIKNNAAIGIISQNFQSNINKINTNTIGTNNCKNDLRWFNDLHDYIGWNANGFKPTCSIGGFDDDMPHGLWCGWSPDSCRNNIFRQKKFIYKSNNENYEKGLPSIEINDTIILEYNSDKSIVSFRKENDNGKLNSHIENLPKGQTYHWLIAHCAGKMCLTVVDSCVCGVEC